MFGSIYSCLRGRTTIVEFRFRKLQVEVKYFEFHQAKHKQVQVTVNSQGGSKYAESHVIFISHDVP
jgi:hypothetical protein